MDGVTDHPFRHITKKYGRPGVVFTEFTSVEGLGHGAIRLLEDFLYDESQRPIVAQIYGTSPDYFYQTGLLLCALGFDGIDINMGCPAKTVAHHGAGAALIKTPELAQAIVRATQKAVLDWHNGIDIYQEPNIDQEILTKVRERHQQLPQEYQARDRVIPVSVKTRVGYDLPAIAEWIPALLETEPAVISIHGRTLKQGYSGEANWQLIAQAAELIHQTETKIIGNGDVDSYQSALDHIEQYGVDGVLIGRGSFGNPFVFLADDDGTRPSMGEIALEHAKLFDATYNHHPKYHFSPMRKHLGWYLRDFPNARQVRIELFQSESPDDVEKILSKYHLL